MFVNISAETIGIRTPNKRMILLVSSDIPGKMLKCESVKGIQINQDKTKVSKKNRKALTFGDLFELSFTEESKPALELYLFLFNNKVVVYFDILIDFIFGIRISFF